jgi:hypothetical protein
MPREINDLTKEKKIRIDVKFDQDVQFSDIVSSPNDMNSLCVLVGKTDKSKIIFPYKTLVTGQDMLNVFFSFSHVESLES